MIVAALLRGIEGFVVKVRAQTKPAVASSLAIEGMREAASRECRVRVEASLACLGQRLDDNTATIVSCDTGGRGAVDGSGFDLAIALAILAPSADVGAIGELSLAGELRPIRGALPLVEALRTRVRRVIVPVENAAEAALVASVEITPARTLADALRLAAGEVASPLPPVAPTASSYPDMRDIVGLPLGRRALEVAAVGDHNLLLFGTPRSGKTMLARRLTGIMPALTGEEALEVTRVHSAAGLNIGGGLITSRPFRAPHHSTTPPGLVGGGASAPRPGEISLAHRGVLFLDELPEFSRAALEVLGEPFREGGVVLARASGTVRFPARTTLVASAAPCPCGWFPDRRCRCSAEDRARYRSRVPARLHDAFDLRVTLGKSDVTAAGPGETTADVRARVLACREALAGVSIDLADTTRAALSRAVTDGLLTSRAEHERVLRVARTLAALDAKDVITERHIVEALELSATGDV